MTLRDVWKRLTEERLDLGRSYLGNLGLALNHFERTNGDVSLDRLEAMHIRSMMRALLEAGRSPRTINNYRAAVFLILDQAFELGLKPPTIARREVRKLKEPEAFPTAWRPEQFDALIAGCRNSRLCRGWGPEHWLTLVLTVYDTSLRIGALLKSDVSQLDVSGCMLRVPGNLQKRPAGDATAPAQRNLCTARVAPPGGLPAVRLAVPPGRTLATL